MVGRGGRTASESTVGRARSRGGGLGSGENVGAVTRRRGRSGLAVVATVAAGVLAAAGSGCSRSEKWEGEERVGEGDHGGSVKCEFGEGEDEKGVED